MTIDVKQLAAIVASGLVNNSLYKKCTRIRPAEYALDVDAVARDAAAIALKIESTLRASKGTPS